MDLVSVFTPCHAAYQHFIPGAYASLAAQTYPNWEWVILAFDGLEVQPAVASDPRVRVIPGGPMGDVNVGRFKLETVKRCRGEILVELDMDDFLTPDCLTEVVKTMPPGEGFAYSNWAQFNENWESTNAPLWNPKPFNWKGHSLWELECWPPDEVMMMMEASSAPSHVRAWTRQAYWKAGGHDPLRPQAEDYDLILRTYKAIGPAKFRQIRKCLYLYRRHTQGDAVEDLYIKSRRHAHVCYMKWKYDVVKKWCESKKLPAVELPDLNGPRYHPLHWRGRECYHRGWPQHNDSVGAIRLDGTLNQLPVMRTLCEAHRVLAPRGWLFLRVYEGFHYPTQESCWDRKFTKYVCHEDYIKRIHPQFLGQFDCKLAMASETAEGTVLDIDLVAVKGERRPIFTEQKLP